MDSRHRKCKENLELFYISVSIQCCQLLYPQLRQTPYRQIYGDDPIRILWKILSLNDATFAEYNVCYHSCNASYSEWLSNDMKNWHILMNALHAYWLSLDFHLEYYFFQCSRISIMCVREAMDTFYSYFQDTISYCWNPTNSIFIRFILSSWKWYPWVIHKWHIFCYSKCKQHYNWYILFQFIRSNSLVHLYFFLYKFHSMLLAII